MTGDKSGVQKEPISVVQVCRKQSSVTGRQKCSPIHYQNYSRGETENLLLLDPGFKNPPHKTLFLEEEQETLGPGSYKNKKQ